MSNKDQYPRSYAEMQTVVRNAKRPRVKLANNTYLEFRDGVAVVTLHDNEIVHAYPNGDFRLFRRGYSTALTVERIRRYTPARLRLSKKEGLLIATDGRLRFVPMEEGVWVNYLGEIIKKGDEK